jgi:neutral ceramidase
MGFHCRVALLLFTTFSLAVSAHCAEQLALPQPRPDQVALRVGVAETDITPPIGFPMAGYYHERLAEGSIDPLKAKAIVFRDNDTAAALVICDLIGIATDLSREVRRLASESTGIPASNIVIAATHSHTAPDYMKELYLYLGKQPQEPLRADYIKKLIDGPVASIVRAHANATPSRLATGFAKQKTPVAFNRRFVMRDGSVRTWQRFSNPDVVRAAGPIDPEIGLLAIQDPQDGSTRGILSNFALHLDTVGGSRWSADYPYFIEQTLRRKLGSDMISLFGTGCCGDINHANPRETERNKVDFIGNAIGESITGTLDQLQPFTATNAYVKSQCVQLPLQDATPQEVDRAVQILELAKRGEKVEFFDHVTAYKKLILDQFRHVEPHVKTAEHITWGLSRSLAGIGETLPVDLTVITIGSDVAIVCLPGEVFVELGLAIKQASPFRTTLLIELSNAVETIYVPHRAAYAGGSYEVTNSALLPGGGEMLVEAALSLLREAATVNQGHAQ